MNVARGCDSRPLIGHTVRRTAFAQYVPTSQATTAALFPSFLARAAAAPSHGYYRRDVAFTVYGRRRLTCARARQTVCYFIFHPLLLLLLFFLSNTTTCPTENQRRRQVSVCARVLSPVTVSDRPPLTSLAVSRQCVCTCFYVRVFECACVLLNQLPCSRYRSSAVAVDLFVFARSRSRLTPSPSLTVHHNCIIFDRRAPVRR